MGRLSFVFTLIAFPLILLGQETLPLLQDIQFEVLTDSLNKNSKVQTLGVEIDCGSATAGQVYELYLRGITGIPVLVDASINNQSLWLIQSQNPGSNDQVLAWNARDEERIQLLPAAWQTPYTLSLRIQISLNNIKDIQNIDQAQIDVTIIRNGQQYRAAATGRGNQINLK